MVGWRARTYARTRTHARTHTHTHTHTQTHAHTHTHTVTTTTRIGHRHTLCILLLFLCDGGNEIQTEGSKIASFLLPLRGLIVSWVIIPLSSHHQSI